MNQTPSASPTTTPAEPNGRSNGSTAAPADVRVVNVRPGRWWVASLLVSLILLVLLLLVWNSNDRTERGNGLTNITDTQRVLVDNSADIGRGGQPDPAQIPTGVFVQTLQFQTAKNVNITGYFWQRFDGDVLDGDLETEEPVIVPTPAGRSVEFVPGVDLPEQIDTTFTIERRYEIFEPPAPDEQAAGTSVGTSVIGWYFEATVRQQFDNDEYPFDRNQVWLRMWPADLLADAILIPDFDGYPCSDPPQPSRACVGEQDTFGIDETIALDEFVREDTFFDYQIPASETADLPYNSNFGLSGFAQQNYPELRFNIALRRPPSELLGTLLPLNVAAVLVFAILLTISADDRRAARFNFSTTQVMTSLSVIFVAVLLQHIQFRSRFDGLVYLDLFYLLMYLMILGVAINAYVVIAPETRDLRVLSFEDNLVTKILYWPSLLGLALAFTVIVL